jgi:hypothetical protein
MNLIFSFGLLCVRFSSKARVSYIPTIHVEIHEISLHELLMFRQYTWGLVPLFWRAGLHVRWLEKIASRDRRCALHNSCWCCYWRPGCMYKSDGRAALAPSVMTAFALSLLLTACFAVAASGVSSHRVCCRVVIASVMQSSAELLRTRLWNAGFRYNTKQADNYRL